jgi:hypothetical protein
VVLVRASIISTFFLKIFNFGEITINNK